MLDKFVSKRKNHFKEMIYIYTYTMRGDNNGEDVQSQLCILSIDMDLVARVVNGAVGWCAGSSGKAKKVCGNCEWTKTRNGRRKAKLFER